MVWKFSTKESKTSLETLCNKVLRLSEDYKQNYILKPYL